VKGDKKMFVGIWVATACNMQCSYCYEGTEKTNGLMDSNVADQVIRFIMERFEYLHKQNDNKLVIEFHGGEPLLNFEIIKYITEAFKNIFKSRSELLLFGITTNATLLSHNIAIYLVENFKFGISISIDGDKSNNDLNRKLYSEKSSYDTIKPKIIDLLKIKPDIRARMTITPATVRNLSKNIEHLAHIGFKTIVSIPDFFDNTWDKDNMETLLREMQKTKEFYLKNKITNPLLSISLIKGKSFKKTSCTGGLTSYHIDPVGNIYPCSYVVGNSEFIIGTLSGSLDKKKLDEIFSYSFQPNAICNGCSNYNCCSASRCKIINKIMTGDYNRPSAIICAVENISHRFTHLN
jgi:uncharacterized protein